MYQDSKLKSVISFWIRREWLIESKAFVRSMKITIVSVFGLSTFSNMSLVNCVSAVMHE